MLSIGTLASDSKDTKLCRSSRGAHSLPASPAASTTLQGDVAGARAAYRKAIDSGHPDWSPAASRNLGYLLKEEGDVAGARAAYRKAIDSGHPDHGPAAQSCTLL